jgi:hypothetical protein
VYGSIVVIIMNLWKRRLSVIKIPEARKSGCGVISVSVVGATAYTASGEIEVPPFALES